MIRTQIQLPEEQVILLKKMAAAEHKSMAEIIRHAIDYFTKAKQPGVDQLRKRAMAATGCFRSGVNDLAVSHDSYLAEVFGK